MTIRALVNRRASDVSSRRVEVGRSDNEHFAKKMASPTSQPIKISYVKVRYRVLGGTCGRNSHATRSAAKLAAWWVLSEPAGAKG